MAPISDELAPVLHHGEQLVACIPVEWVFASKHDFFPTRPHVLITDQRIGFVSRKGMMKKRMQEDVSWPLTAFTSRVNSNEGSVSGKFRHHLTLFTQDDETVTAAFDTTRERDAYKGLVGSALAPVLRSPAP